MLKCHRCKDILPEDRFYPDNTRNPKRGRQYWCKSCSNSYQRDHDKKMRRHSPEYRDKHRGYALKKVYGISMEDYTNLLNSQLGMCAICGEYPIARKLSVDHCHDTGKIRGLLCLHCNMGIGYLKDNKKILESAIEYLGKYSENQPTTTHQNTCLNTSQLS